MAMVMVECNDVVGRSRRTLTPDCCLEEAFCVGQDADVAEGIGGVAYLALYGDSFQTQTQLPRT